MARIALILVALLVPVFAAHAAKRLKLRNTYYYVVLEKDYAKYPADAQILSLSGSVLANVSHQFKNAVDIEGTGRLHDGRVINFAARVDGRVRYLISPAQWGYGVARCQLKPFRTVAVDPKVVKLGSLIYIAETDGMPLPDGTLHDGLWVADDIGSAIQRDRIDLFVGDGNRGDVLAHVGITNLKPLHVKVVRGPSPDSCVHDYRP